MQTSAKNQSKEQSPSRNHPKRKLKNYLLVPAFQLRYTAIIVGLSAILCTVLGFIIYERTQVAYQQTQEALENAELAHENAAAANAEARAATRMLHFDDLLANPDDAKKALDENDAKYAAKEIESQETVSKMLLQKKSLETDAKYTLLYLASLLGVLVLALGVFGVVITHRVAGPLFVMGRMFERLTKGNFLLQKRSLRKGDQLTDLFQKGVEAVQSLHDQAATDLRVLEKSLALLVQLKDNHANPEIIKQLEEQIRQVALHKARAIGKELSTS